MNQASRIELDANEWAVLYDNLPVVMAAVHWDTAVAMLADIGVNGVEFLHNVVGLRLTGWQVRQLTGRPSYLHYPTCRSCNTLMRIRRGPSGIFWGCSRFPNCRRTVSAADTIVLEPRE